jgi:hypothetical protein
MTDKWFLQDIEKSIKQHKRVVVNDPSGNCEFLIELAKLKGYSVLQTDITLREKWQTVKEELFIRYKAEKELKEEKVIFYVKREKSKLSFLFDYCFTNGCVDLTNPAEWIRKKLVSSTGMQISMENPLLLTAAKLGVGKEIGWWKRILQNLEDLMSVEDELLPFLDNPDLYFKVKDADIRRLFEEKLFEILGAPYMPKPPKTIAGEITSLLFDRLINNDVNPELLSIYYKWLDSNTYSSSLQGYVDSYKLDKSLNIWNVHPDHCFTEIDHLQLVQIVGNFRDHSFVKERLDKVKQRLKGRKTQKFIPSWWSDVITLFEFENKPLSTCNSFENIVAFYTSEFHKADRAIRNLYSFFIQDQTILRPLQEHYESLNHELLQHWYDVASEYKNNQQGYLVSLFKQAKPGIAVIVGDGLRYEIADYVASQLSKKYKVERATMLADMPSETEHNMSALYVGNDEVLPVHKDREKRLCELLGKKIDFINLEAVNPSTKSEYIVLTYKDIDSAGEKLQMGAIKLFSEFERVLVEKIELLLNNRFKEVHLLTDHGFVLTGLLDESDKIEVEISGKKEVHERFVRTIDKLSAMDMLMFEKPYGDFKYVYAAKNHRPFKSKGLYGFSHGGFTPQEIIIPNFVFRKIEVGAPGLEVLIENKSELADVTGVLFGVKVSAKASTNDLFAENRKVQVVLYANNISYSSSNVINVNSGESVSVEFSFMSNSEVTAILIDSGTQEQLDSVKIKKSNARDLGGLL